MHRPGFESLRLPIGMLAVAVAVVTAGCHKETPPAKQPAGVEVAVASIADVPVSITAVGTVDPVQKVEVKPQVSGPIREVRFVEGDAVTVGQPLFFIDKRPFEAIRAQVSALQKAARIQAEAAKRDLDRGTALFEKQMISAGELDGLRAAADAANAAVAVQDAAARTAALNLEYSTVPAPISGRAGRLLAFPGDVVTAGVTPLVQINQTAPINVRFSVPERDLAAVRAALAGGSVPVTAIPKAGTGEPSTGELVFIDNEVDARTGAITLKATFDNTDERLWPGQFVVVTARLGVEKGVVTVPAHAVQTGQAGSFVFIVDGDKARQKAVRTGISDGAITVITDGVNAGDTVVTEGHLKLADGSPVKVKTESPDDPVAGNPAK